jgi:DNA-binding NtrC family response regulator
MGPPRGSLYPAARHKILVSGTVTAQLVAIDGPLRGSTYALTGDPFSIGRKSDNTLSPSDLSISRQHCTIDCVLERFQLTDHDSQNGTFVNGIPIKERVLVHGDQIAIGSSVFVFLLEEPDSLSGPTTVPIAPQRPAVPPALEHRLVGESPAIRHVLEFVAQVAPLDSMALITGEKGTGKELAARELHDNSPRSQKPFVAVNCAALSETFLNSEMFGHERGAFTGAAARKKGKLELAEGGTLFLDEIAELSPPLQGKLLRVLQERQFERLGGTRTMAADLRVIAATSRDLPAAVREGAFRQDLYFRLCVLSLEMPPLRHRREDIPLLANYFRIQHAARQKRRVLGITAAAPDCLLRYDWPGNVRESEGAIETAAAVGSTEGILPEDLPESVLPSLDTPAGILPRFHQILLETKRELILKAYQQARGSHVHAAALLGLHPNSLERPVRTQDLQAALQSLNGGS